ncbi:tetratricopeptide repeat protein [Paludibaculum fermentans]|uniref:Sel1 repeat family protein n=1 Tax=Paludibaculum fermentans TaxID=1473598 RepID=A0A7S7NR16_PALFE|nr:tetratricopeptide repeat protein [Paludibaculum fermentans]QOY88129.1 sel1 repeat family protein [Paludibaculum fermentans]
MEEPLRQELLAKTKQALDGDDWEGVVRLWQPWVDLGDCEAEYQLAYHYFWCTPCDDDLMRGSMLGLMRAAAAQEHPEAIWFLAHRELQPYESNPEYQRELLRAGRLGSVHAQRALGVAYATGDWAGPQDLVEAVRWYRLAAEAGEAESRYDLGFMLLLGEGGEKDTEEGLMWLERAAEQGESSALRLLVDCYEKGHCDVPVNAARAQIWRGHLEEYERLHPRGPSRQYSMEGAASPSSLEGLLDMEGVTGFGFAEGQSGFLVSYDSAVITASQLDGAIRAAGISAVPAE